MTAPRHPRPSLILCACLLAGACVDSSLPGDDGGGGFPPPVDPPTIDVMPPEWTTLPGKTQTFSAIDPVSNQPLIWTAPGELSVVDQTSHSITLKSGKAKGTFELLVQSSVDPEVVGKAKVRVKGFGYSGTFTKVPGLAADQPMADVEVTRGTGPESDRRVFLATYELATGVSEVGVWDAGFTTQLASSPVAHFNPVQRPRLAADAHGNAYWIEQYFDPALMDRARAIQRLAADGTLTSLEWTPADLGGWQLVPGTDVACDDAGALYFLAEDGLANWVLRFADPFTAGALPEPVAPLAATGPQVRLAVDAEGRLLVAVDAGLERWTLPPGGAGVIVERLGDLDAAPVDLDADAQGNLYALFDTRVEVLDGDANELAALTKAEVGLPSKIPFEHLLGLGVDGEGDLRLVDDPLVDDPLLGASKLRTYALDVQQP